jgi:phenylalanyl-tRNA synthetase alpha chain
MMKSLGRMDPEDRRVMGAALNAVKDDVAAALDARKNAFETAALNARLESERVDVSLPVRSESQGALHPISQTIDEVVAIFGQMGFELAEGPDIEDDFHNFTALNFPPGHPARDMHDTFFLPQREDGSRHVLRTHTSPVQIRTMQTRKPPIRVICLGRTYRCDSDMTHTPMFHQIEGLVIDSETNMGHLKGCLKEFIEAYFEVENVPMQFRPSFFPFTEPSAEVDIGCSRKNGELKIGEGDSWLEILGCGMVHPNVLKACGYDPNEVQGFAFGMGLERIAMLKYGIPDLRTFFDSDLRWLRHYGFACLDVPTLTGGLTR